MSPSRRLYPSPRKAIVLAAGYGSRMQPLSRDLPKATMPFWNKSLLARAVERLYGWGVRQCLMNVHHGATEVIREAIDLGRAGWPVTLSFEPEILGTGGALPHARWFLDDAPCWLMNADVVLDGVPTGLCRALQAPDTIAALWMHATRGPRTVCCADGYVQNFRAPQPAAPGTATFCGVQLIRPELLEYLPPRGFASIIAAYEQAMANGWRVAAHQVPGTRWADVGTPTQYLAAHAEWAPARAQRATHFVCVASGARVAAKARVRDSVIWAGAQVGPAARIEHAIIGRGVRVNTRVTGMVVKATDGLTPNEQSALESAGWRLDATAVNPLPPRGSNRSFLRLLFGRKRAMLVRYQTARRENAYYARQTRFLWQQGWPVPEVIHDCPAEQWTLYADLGDDSLLQRMTPRTVRSARAYYDQVIDEIGRLHGPISRQARRARVPLMPPFTAATYRYERQLFLTHFVAARLGWSPTRRSALDRELRLVAAHLLKVRPVLIHRDLQSSNILLHRQRVQFIDFQGMRYGPAAYDLASLLCDPYVAIPARWQTALRRRYQQQAVPGTFSEEHYRWACVQRLVQVLGALARLAELPGCGHFDRHLPVALDRLQQALSACPELTRLREVHAACSKGERVADG